MSDRRFNTKELNLTTELETCLQDVEERIDPAQEEENLAQWRRFLDNQFAGNVFSPVRKPAPAKVSWPGVHINDALENIDLMILDQFRGVSEVLAGGGGGALNVRCNYGSAILGSLFGCKPFIMPRETGTLPTVEPLNSREAISRLLDQGVPDIRAGFGGRVWACAERILSVFAKYPKIGRYVRLYHPDLQGPIDNVEVVWGSEMFYAFSDEPETIRAALALMTETYRAFMQAWYRLVPQAKDISAHWGFYHRGVLMLRNDSLMNLSPEIYVEFIQPMDQKLLDEFGGGAIHFCGRGDHYIAPMSRTRGLYAINMSQPHLNDMERIYQNTVDRKIKLIGFDRKTAEAALAAGRKLHGQVHG